MQYNPAKIIANTPLPILIINGDKDLQVDVKEAQLLNSAAQNSKLIIIEHMNHVLVKIDGDDLENAKSSDISKLGLSDTIGVLLPISSFCLNDKYAKGRYMVDANCAIAIATNFNPGSALSPSIPFAIFNYISSNIC